MQTCQGELWGAAWAWSGCAGEDAEGGVDWSQSACARVAEGTAQPWSRHIGWRSVGWGGAEWPWSGYSPARGNSPNPNLQSGWGTAQPWSKCLGAGMEEGLGMVEQPLSGCLEGAGSSLTSFKHAGSRQSPHPTVPQRARQGSSWPHGVVPASELPIFFFRPMRIPTGQTSWLCGLEVEHPYTGD